jgi:hypothetical protein
MQKINFVDPKYVLIKYKIQEFEVDLTWCGFKNLASQKESID